MCGGDGFGVRVPSLGGGEFGNEGEGLVIGARVAEAAADAVAELSLGGAGTASSSLLGTRLARRESGTSSNSERKEAVSVGGDGDRWTEPGGETDADDGGSSCSACNDDESAAKDDVSSAEEFRRKWECGDA